MLIRIIYFFVIFIFFEISILYLSYSNFIENFKRETDSIIRFSDQMGIDNVLHLSRFIENLDNPEDKKIELNSYFARILANKNLIGGFNIQNIILLSMDGSLLAGEDLNQNSLNLEADLPIFMKALRMRRGQTSTTVYEKEYFSEESFLQNKLMSAQSELSDKKIIASAPLYRGENMQVWGSVHILYERLNIIDHLILHKNLFKEIILKNLLVGILSSLILWLIFYILSNILIYEKISEESYEFALNKKVDSIKKNEILESDKSSKSMDAVYLD